MSSPGDLLGVESCIDLRTNHDMNSNPTSNGYRSFTPAKAMKKNVRREYPPPLPSLGFEMKRYCTGDGRLIIREEKTSRPLHDVFRADRSNGRLTLHFLRFEEHNDGVLGHDDDDDVDCDDSTVGGVFQMDDDVDLDEHHHEVEVMPAAACNSSVRNHGFGEQKRVMTT